jgi:predicted ArsR family transcriptional regulator
MEREILTVLETPASLIDLAAKLGISEQEAEEALRNLINKEQIIWMEGKFYLN